MIHIVLVTGARDWKDRAAVWSELDTLAKSGDVIVYEGGADGADRYAREWALSGKAVGYTSNKALWNRYGNGAGPIRNERQSKLARLEYRDLKSEGKDARLICLAFPLPRRDPFKKSGTERQMDTCERMGFEVLDRGKR